MWLFVPYKVYIIVCWYTQATRRQINITQFNYCTNYYGITVKNDEYFKLF